MALASSSPRRRVLLGKLLPSFDILTSPVEETGDTRMPLWPLEAVNLPVPFTIAAQSDPRLWAWRKANDVLSRHGGSFAEGALLLGADTVVVARERLLGKPADRRDAGEMLMLLRGRAHYVVTGFVLLRVGETGAIILHVEAVSSKVTMKAFSEAELTAYLETSEPYDKAGAYALQGLGGNLVERVEGCHTNVIGLPVCRVRSALWLAGLGLLAYPEGGYCPGCPLRSGQSRPR